MANVKITQLPLATSSTGADLAVIVTGGTTKQISNTNLFTNAALTTPTITGGTLSAPTLSSPVMTTPTLGVATATSINKVTITAPASSATLTIANGKTLTVSNSLTFSGTDGKTAAFNNSLTFAGTDGKTLTFSNSLTFAGTDSTTLTFPSSSATIARTDAAQTFTGLQTFTTGVIGGVQSLSGAGAVDVVTLTTKFTSTATGDALTLANGTEGQLKMIVYIAEAAGADTGILTPTNLGAASTITFDAVGNACLLQYLGSDWWIVANYGCTVA